MNERKYNEIYINNINKNLYEHEKSYKKAIDYIHSSTAIYHDEYISFPYMPKMFTRETINFFNEISAITHKILTKVIKEYIKNEEYRKLFNFDKKLEELILKDTGYAGTLPIVRIDLFFNEDDSSFKFCEFNADGASAMNEDRELYNATKDTLAFKEFTKEYNLSNFELFYSWIDEMMKIYSTYKYKVENPTVAIVDFLESATINEFNIFKECFEKKGYKTFICDVRDLKIEDNKLRTRDGDKIDLVYRRAVTGEMMEKYEQAFALINAIKNDLACVIGGIRTQVIHNKIIFMILRSDATYSFLNDKEIKFIKEHIPYTVKLNTGEFDIREVVDNKDEYIIKPYDLYGSRGVYAGVDYTWEEFEKLVKENTDSGYLLQEYAKIYKSDNFIIEDGKFKMDKFDNLTGLYIYNGKFKGILSRQGREGIICGAKGGTTLTNLEIK